MLYRYNLFLHEEDILRVGGRWQQTTWSFEMKHPILLGRHNITQLLVRHYHTKYFHVGVDAMLMGRTCDNSELQGRWERIFELSRGDATKRFQHILSIKEHLSQRWREEYVSQMRIFNNNKGRNVTEGEVVLIIYGKKKRSQLSLGLVKKVFQGRDNKIRFLKSKLAKLNFCVLFSLWFFWRLPHDHKFVHMIPVKIFVVKDPGLTFLAWRGVCYRWNVGTCRWKP